MLVVAFYGSTHAEENRARSQGQGAGYCRHATARRYNRQTARMTSGKGEAMDDVVLALRRTLRSLGNWRVLAPDSGSVALAVLFLLTDNI